MKIARLYPGSDGESHFEDIEVELFPGPETEHLAGILHIKGAQFRRTPAGGVWDFHRADCRKLMIILDGQVEIGVGDGTKRIFGPGDVLRLEDTTGHGHTTRVLGNKDRTCIDIKLEAPAMPSRADHDRAVRFIAATRFPFPGQTDWPPDNLTLTNETERRRGIETPEGTHYPDIVIVSRAGTVREVAEVETEVGEAAARIWARSSAASDNGTKTGVKHFFVYVPPGEEQHAIALLDRHGISYAGVRTWSVEAGRIRIVPVVTTGDPKDHRELLSE